MCARTTVRPEMQKIVPLRLLIFCLGASHHVAPNVFVNAYSGEQSELMSFLDYIYLLPRLLSLAPSIPHLQALEETVTTTS